MKTQISKKYVVRQCGKYSEFCYYQGFEIKHRWTKKLSNDWLYDSIEEAKEVKNRLKYNFPKVMEVGLNNNGIIKYLRKT